MPNYIFEKILDDHISKFKNEFANLPKELFFDDGKLFHPGEYGKYREEIIKRLFRTILYEDLKISEGFIINNNNERSTQCDIIIYDYKNTPILKDSNKIFIPVETTVGVGEIKSELTKNQFKEALRKLAKNKSLKEFATGSIIKRPKRSNDFDPKREYCDQLFSVLICKKLKFDINNIDFEDIYEGIERRNRHNVLLSVEDGLFNYFFSFDLMTEIRKDYYKSLGTNTEMSSNIEFPNFLNVDCVHNFISQSDNNNHIKEFISYVHSGIHNATILNVDIRTYYRDFNCTKGLFAQ